MNTTINLQLSNYDNLSLEQIDIALNNLSLAKNCFILSETDVEKQRDLLMNAKQQKILISYPIRIWQTTDGTWKAHVPDSTKERNRKILQGKTKELLENKILADYYQNCDERLLFKNYFPYWLMEYKSTYVSGGTLQRNYNDYKKFIKDSFIDSMRITDISSLDLRKFLNKAINEHNLTRRAFSNLNSIFNGLFQYALECGDITQNPTLNVHIKNTNMKPEEAKTGQTEVFNNEEAELLINYIFHNYMEIQPIISLALLLNFQLGLRVGELCTLKKSDVLFDENVICINRTEKSYRPLELVDGKIIEHTTIHIVCDGKTKKDSNRIIPLSNEAICIIKEVLRLQSEMNIKSEFLFPHENGEHILRERYNEILEHYCKKVSIKVKSMHKTRKTVLSRLFSNGFGLDEVMQISGHRDKNTLLKHYIFSINNISTQATRMNNALSSGNTFQEKPTHANPNLEK